MTSNKKGTKCRYAILGERSSRHSGCRNGSACPFAHPEDPSWARARTPTFDNSPVRSRFNGRGGRDYDYEAEYERERERNHDRPARRRSPSVRRSPSPSEYRRRRRKSHSPVASSSRRGEARSPSGSREKYNDKADGSISSTPECNRRESLTQAKAILPTPPATGVDSTTTAYSPRIAKQEESSTVTSPPTAPRGMRQALSTDASQISSSNMQPMASSQTMPLPPPPETPPPKESLGPPPLLPEGLILGDSAPPEQSDDGARRKLADDQIALISKAVKAVHDIQELEQERVNAATVVEAQNFSALPEVIQERMRGQLAEIEDKLLATNAEFAQLKEKYISGDLWPDKPPLISDDAAAAEESNQKNYETIIKYIKGLHTDLNQIFANIPLVKDNLNSSITTEGDDNATNSTHPGSAMDVDQEGDEHVGTSMQSTTDNNRGNRKRRRLTRDVDGFSRINSQGNGEVSNEELEELRSKLETLGTSVRTMENDLNANNEEVADTIINIVNSRYDTALNEQKQELRSRSRRRKEKEKEQVDTIDAAKLELSAAKDQITQLTSASSMLFNEISNVRAQLDEQNNARNFNLARLANLEERLQQYSAQQETNGARSATLQAALNAYARPLSSSPQTDNGVASIPPANYVALVLKDSIEAEVRAQLQPHIEKHRAEVASQIEKGNAAISTNVWASTDNLRSLVSVVSGILDQKQQKSPKRSPQQRNASAGPSSEGSLNEL